MYKRQVPPVPNSISDDRARCNGDQPASALNNFFRFQINGTENSPGSSTLILVLLDVERTNPEITTEGANGCLFYHGSGTPASLGSGIVQIDFTPVGATTPSLRTTWRSSSKIQNINFIGGFPVWNYYGRIKATFTVTNNTNLHHFAQGRAYEATQQLLTIVRPPAPTPEPTRDPNVNVGSLATDRARCTIGTPPADIADFFTIRFEGPRNNASKRAAINLIFLDVNKASPEVTTEGANACVYYFGENGQWFTLSQEVSFDVVFTPLSDTTPSLSVAFSRSQRIKTVNLLTWLTYRGRVKATLTMRDNRGFTHWNNGDVTEGLPQTLDLIEPFNFPVLPTRVPTLPNLSLIHI